MSNKPTLSLTTESVRPFLPAKDFELSKRFYEALGFVRETDGEVAIFRIGGSSFILQRHFQKGWAEEFLMQLMVDDLDAWWAHLVALELPGNLACRPESPGAPALGSAHFFLVDLCRRALARSAAPAGCYARPVEGQRCACAREQDVSYLASPFPRPMLSPGSLAARPRGPIPKAPPQPWK